MKKYPVLALLFLSVFLISACTTKISDSDAVNTGQITETRNGPGFDEQGRRMPDFGQPKEDADLRGLVTSIVGNEVTVLKIERPQMGTRTDTGQEENNKTDSASEAARPVGGIGTGTGGRMPGMGGGMRSGATDAESQAAMLERIKEMSSGEEKIIIPVGIQMLKSDTSTEGEPKMIEASLSDIKSNSMITVWLDDSATDKKMASFVMIMK